MKYRIIKETVVNSDTGYATVARHVVETGEVSRDKLHELERLFKDRLTDCFSAFHAFPKTKEYKYRYKLCYRRFVFLHCTVTYTHL